ncbi:hypothetical protein, partial [Enterobacter roggenkampii]|uniref:hypothetical protein n=1 Tax=Enterobacter roggenkampii TaxID=1812935 RepID=UPI00292C2E3B
NVIPELAGGWNDGLACFIFRFLKRPHFDLLSKAYCVDVSIQQRVVFAHKRKNHPARWFFEGSLNRQVYEPW